MNNKMKLTNINLIKNVFKFTIFDKYYLIYIIKYVITQTFVMPA
jgi:hypothetical protein